MRETIRAFVEHEVPFTIATDGPEMMRTHLRDELELLHRIGALDEVELREANARGHAAAFRRSVGVASVSTFDPDLGRSETPEEHKKRLEREHGELLQELRALIPGATVLFGFLLGDELHEQFGDWMRAERYVYYVTLVCTAVALVLFLAPAAHHRLRFREGDKDTPAKGNREAIAGTVASAIAFTGVLYLVDGAHLRQPGRRVGHGVAVVELRLLRTLQAERRESRG